MPASVNEATTRQPPGERANFLSSEFLTEDELSEAISKGPRTLRAWRQRRIGPPWVKIGNDPYYPRDGFLKWVRSRIVDPSAEKQKRG